MERVGNVSKLAAQMMKELTNLEKVCLKELKAEINQVNFLPFILLTSSNNQISEFRIPNIYNEILFILFFAWSKVGPTVSSAKYIFSDLEFEIW